MLFLEMPVFESLRGCPLLLRLIIRSQALLFRGFDFGADYPEFGTRYILNTSNRPRPRLRKMWTHGAPPTQSRRRIKLLFRRIPPQ